jgi:cytochrome b involved in lipid metabolism
MVASDSATTPVAVKLAIPLQVVPTLPVAETKTQAKTVTAVFLSAAEVAKHSTAADCWMIINGKVYNFTSYEKLHPGGMAQIVQACGRDGSSLYATKGGGGSSHSNYADSLLVDYYVGDIGKTPSKPASVSPAKLAADTPKTPVAPTPAPAPSSGQTTGATVSLTAAEVAKHNTAADCWMIINGNVYDLTSYERIHPGGMAQIVQACGRDGSSLYATKGGGGGSHSNYADSQLAGYLVGTLGGQTTTTQIQQAQQQAASTSQNQPQGGGENEEEDDD